jgi:hypothetical protein
MIEKLINCYTNFGLPLRGISVAALRSLLPLPLPLPSPFFPANCQLLLITLYLPVSLSPRLSVSPSLRLRLFVTPSLRLFVSSSLRPSFAARNFSRCASISTASASAFAFAFAFFSCQLPTAYKGRKIMRPYCLLPAIYRLLYRRTAVRSDSRNLRGAAISPSISRLVD